jgi:hypothetical protein
MPIKTSPTYTENEVSKILKQSESASVSAKDGAEGHAEGLHELEAVGKNRASTTIAALENRIFGEEKKTKSGAFSGCQAKAVAWALNRKAGQMALSWLCMDNCEFVFVTVDISAGNFAMVGLDGLVTEPASSGADFIVSPAGVVARGFPVPVKSIAQGIAMKLMKTESKDLHIRTAYPLASAPKPPQASIRWKHGKSQDQDLPA